MAYSVPLTAVSGTGLTAAQWNASVRDNILATAPAKATSEGGLIVTTGPNAVIQRTPKVDSVAAAENTTLTSFGDLPSGTVGPSVTVTHGTSALVLLHSRITANTVNVNTRAGFEISGSHTRGGSNDLALAFEPSVVGQDMNAGTGFLITGLTPGSSTFKMVYKVDSAATGTFSSRRLTVVPL